MSNPPAWVYYTKHNVNVIGAESMASASVAAGVVTAAQVNSQPDNTGGNSWGVTDPATWSTAWFVIALIYLLGIYYGMIRLHSGK